MSMDENQLELENRIKNLLWTVSGDYTLDMKPDVEAFLRTKEIALYDGVKQGAFAKYYDKEELGLYLIKKIYMEAEEGPLTSIAQLCMEEAVGERIRAERPGVDAICRKAFDAILDQEFERMAGTPWGRLKFAIMKKYMDDRDPSERQVREWMKLVYQCNQAPTSRQLIEIIDQLYNQVVDPNFEKNHGDLEKVLAVTLEELAEFSWQDFLSEEMYEDAMETYLEQLTDNITNMESLEELEEEEEKEDRAPQKQTIKVVTPEALEKMHSYVELNFGLTYLPERDNKRINYHMCRDIHSDCSLYFTEGILQNPVKHNYQLEYARKNREKNRFLYYDKHRTVKRNISALTDALRKSLVMRSEVMEVDSHWGRVVPAKMWKVGRTDDTRLFRKEVKGDNSDFVVDVLIDASGSQRTRQGEVAIQGYMISESLSNVGIAHRVMSFCTFWDYTIMHRFRDYDDDRSRNERIFDYMTSSNNRDGLAVKAAGYDLLLREEEKKILIILSDGRPYDVILNRPNARNPKPYEGKYAIRDTGFEVRKLRNMGVSVLGVFAGEEKDLATEKKIFGKDFAYIHDIENFSKIVGKYLTRQLDRDL